MFTGTPSDTLPPPDWTGCVHNYQATYPLNSALPAYTGSSYAAIYFSSNGGDTTNGAISGRMSAAFVPSTAYTFNIALANIPVSNLGSFNGDAAVCEIFGGFSACDMHELLQTIYINSSNQWQLDTFTCHPEFADTFITIRVTTQSIQTGFSFYLGVGEIDLVCSTPTGISDITSAGINIYPNPSNGLVNIYTGNNLPFTLNLYDLSGRETITREMAGTVNTLDVNELAKGVYVVKVIQQATSYCKRLIIQ